MFLCNPDPDAKIQSKAFVCKHSTASPYIMHDKTVTTEIFMHDALEKQTCYDQPST